jgi:tetratricopeptide (TPR) repeat protein
MLFVARLMPAWLALCGASLFAQTSSTESLNLRMAGNLAAMFPQPTGPAFVLPDELQITPRALPQTNAPPSLPVVGGVVKPAGLVAPVIQPPVRVQSLVPETGLNTGASARSADFDKFYLQEKYSQAVSEGLKLVQGGVVLTQEQRLRLANALAWTGKTDQALPYYRGLFFTPFDAAARLGLANAERWRGRQELAAPAYQQVLAVAPDNPDARIGLTLASRQLRPSTVLGLGRAQDNQGLVFDNLNAMHTWRNSTGLRIYAVQARGVQSSADALPGFAPYQQAQNKSLGVRFEALDLRFAPRLHVDVQTAPDTQIFGGVRLKLTEGATYASLSRVNWGAQNYSARSIAARHSATQLGLDHTSDSRWGELAFSANAYQVSDSNSLLTSQIKFTPAWRPLGSGFKTFVVTDTRNARLSTPDYWSPTSGHGTASLGLSQSWEADNWSLFASAQAGNRLYGDGGQAWSASLAGKRWLTPDYALGFNATTLANRRDDAAYRASFVNVNVEKLW